jgi:hypothetical protein
VSTFGDTERVRDREQSAGAYGAGRVAARAGFGKKKRFSAENIAAYR